jgi:SAM-dependent methyltransferase
MKAQRVAEVRAEHLLTELLSAQGWNTQRPPKGELLRQQEYKDHPHLLEIFKGKSKSAGGGDGLPEAVLVDENAQPLAVIEVKGAQADLPKAIDEVTNKYGKWCIESGFTPLAIALAGTSDSAFGLCVFKWARNKWVPVTYDGNPINWIPNRADLERLRTPNTPAELRPSVPPAEVLAARADEINRLLREANITDARRPAIVGAIMLALWKSKGKIRRDPEYILGDVNEAAQKAFWTAGKPKIADSLSVPVANKDLAKSAIRISSILERLNVTVLNAETDYLGQLYETFFIYVGGNTIGQIFTPRHIAAFMAELADVQRDDDVLDPACGTGGFLIAAMNRVQQRSKLSRAQMVEIVKVHLVGFETEPTTAALCVANMILRGDGSTRVRQGSCFTSKDFEPGKASIVLMNPPFPHESTDTPPEEFIARALEGLRPRGFFAAILPQSLMVKRDKQQWRDEILKHHTLRGVIALPDELFQPFAAATTAILILEKGVPHPANAKVFFARIDNDGFKLKKGVRLPRDGSQLPAILDAFNNKKSIPRLCGWAVLDPSEALWHTAAPHYVPASALTLAEVTTQVRELARSRASFVVRHASELHSLTAAVGNGALVPKLLQDIKKPTPITAAANTIGALFHIYGGQRELHNKEKLVPGQTLVISSSGTDNGAYGFFDFEGLLKPPFATVPGTGSIGEAFVQEWPCGVTDHCYILVPKPGAAPELLYVACATIRQEQWRFSYGAQITPRRIAWLPMPTDAATIAAVKDQLASAARIEALALDEAADEIDKDVSRRRLAEIKKKPSALVSGQDLDERLAKLQS